MYARGYPAFLRHAGYKQASSCHALLAVRPLTGRPPVPGGKQPTRSEAQLVSANSISTACCPAGITA